jgi:hypothetical protein
MIYVRVVTAVCIVLGFPCNSALGQELFVTSVYLQVPAEAYRCRNVGGKEIDLSNRYSGAMLCVVRAPLTSDAGFRARASSSDLAAAQNQIKQLQQNVRVLSDANDALTKRLNLLEELIRQSRGAEDTKQ